MPCYILQCGDTDMVKIGWADRDVEARRRDLQCAHWHELRVIRTIDGAEAIERAMHRRFKHRRVAREWFRFDPEMLTYKPAVEQSVPPGRAIVQAVCGRFGGQAGLGRALGIGEGTVSGWVSAGVVPYVRIVEIIAVGRRLSPAVLLTPNEFFPPMKSAA